MPHSKSAFKTAIVSGIYYRRNCLLSCGVLKHILWHPVAKSVHISKTWSIAKVLNSSTTPAIPKTRPATCLRVGFASFRRELWSTSSSLLASNWMGEVFNHESDLSDAASLNWCVIGRASRWWNHTDTYSSQNWSNFHTAAFNWIKVYERSAGTMTSCAQMIPLKQQYRTRSLSLSSILFIKLCASLT